MFQIIRFTDEEDDTYVEVQSLNLWSENFTTNTLPEGIFLDWNEVNLVGWNNCISIGYARKESFELMVLQDYKKQKWTPKKIIIPVKGPAKNDTGLKLAKEERIFCSSKFDLHISDEGDYRLSLVGKGVMGDAKCGVTGEILHKPSLVSFKGIMMPENGYHDLNIERK